MALWDVLINIMVCGHLIPDGVHSCCSGECTVHNYSLESADDVANATDDRPVDDDGTVPVMGPVGVAPPGPLDPAGPKPT